jgi:DNA repair protein RAD5
MSHCCSAAIGIKKKKKQLILPAKAIGGGANRAGVWGEISRAGVGSVATPAEMGKERQRDEQVAMVRAVLGEGTAKMDIIRALHMAGDDPTKAINILLDFDHRPPPTPTPSSSQPPAKPSKTLTESTPPTKVPTQPRPTAEKPKPAPTPAPATTNGGGEHWWLVGSAEMAGLSTCKGRRIAPGDAVAFSFPTAAAATAAAKSRPGRFALASCSSEIMRFSTPNHGEVHYLTLVLLTLNCTTV